MAGMHALFACLRETNVKNGEKLTVFKALYDVGTGGIPRYKLQGGKVAYSKRWQSCVRGRTCVADRIWLPRGADAASPRCGKWLAFRLSADSAAARARRIRLNWGSAIRYSMAR